MTLRSARLPQPTAFEAAEQSLLQQVLAGLHERPKRLSTVWLYDERGARLFEQICTLPEYHIARTELALLQAHAPDIAANIGPNAALVELGSGASVKTRVLLQALDSPCAYIPIDISASHLRASAAAIAADHEGLAVQSICADFTLPLELPAAARQAQRRVIYLAGSTFGNFAAGDAIALLTRMRDLAGEQGALLISVDLRKDPAVLESAYNDAGGVTAEFNRNVLNHLNYRLDADFDPRRFIHHAVWVEPHTRIEMRLASTCDQVVRIGGRSIRFAQGEYLLTEYCYKYTPERFAALAAAAGVGPRRSWTNEEQRFTMQLLEPSKAGASEDSAWPAMAF